MKVSQPKTQILIVDDHPLVREGLTMRLSLQSDLQVCGEAASVDEALAAIEQQQPHLAIIDLSLHDSQGLDLIKQIKTRYPSVLMLVLSGFQESLYAERCLRAGAVGYLNKQESNEKLLLAVRTVLAGERFLSPELAARLINTALGSEHETKSPMEQLTDRELEIFQMIGCGVKTGVIAERLFLSRHTVDTHRENIKRKLGILGGAELSRAAVEWTLAQNQ